MDPLHYTLHSFVNELPYFVLAGTYPCIFVEICLLRDLGFYITQTFLPSSLFVVLSWLSFWLDPDAVPGRISLGLLTVLTLTTQTSSVTALLPKVNHLIALVFTLTTRQPKVRLINIITLITRKP